MDKGFDNWLVKIVSFSARTFENLWKSLVRWKSCHKCKISEHVCFGRLDKISVFYAVLPPLTFLLKTLHCSYVNCDGLHKHERLLMIMVQQVLKRWIISLNLSEDVPQLSTPWWDL